MPLHDWSDRHNFGGLHTLWTVEIYRALGRALPAGYEAHLGSSPFVSVGGDLAFPDVGVRRTEEPIETAQLSPNGRQPDATIDVLDISEDTVAMVTRDGRLVAAIELVSPRNKDRPASREQYASHYAAYVLSGVSVLVVDIHRRPAAFSFSRAIGEAIGHQTPAGPAPEWVAFGVGHPSASRGRFVDIWRRPLVVGERLPEAAVPLDPDEVFWLDLEATYLIAATDMRVR